MSVCTCLRATVSVSAPVCLPIPTCPLRLSVSLYLPVYCACLSPCLPVFLSTCTCLSANTNLCACPPIPTCLSPYTYLSVALYLPVCMSPYTSLSVCPPIPVYLFPYDYLSVCPIYLHVCLSPYTYMSACPLCLPVSLFPYTYMSV